MVASHIQYCYMLCYVNAHLLLLSSSGTGCLLQAVETAAQQKAQTVGKPSKFMFESLALQFGVDRERCLMVGDRLDTDILLGSNCGLKTLLTLTGVSTLADAEAHEKSGCTERQKMVPDYYVDSIADLLPALQAWSCCKCVENKEQLSTATAVKLRRLRSVGHTSVPLSLMYLRDSSNLLVWRCGTVVNNQINTEFWKHWYKQIHKKNRFMELAKIQSSLRVKATKKLILKWVYNTCNFRHNET